MIPKGTLRKGDMIRFDGMPMSEALDKIQAAVGGTIVLRQGDFTELQPPTMSRHVEVFNCSGESFAVPSLKRYGPMAINGVRDVRLYDRLTRSGWEPTAFEIHFHQTIFRFKAFVDSVVRISMIDSVDTLNIQLRITGPVNIVQQEVKKVAQKIRNKFYVGHPKMSSSFEQDQDNVFGEDRGNGRWSKKTLKDAIAHAEEILEKDPKQQECVVVQVVKIVRRPKPKFIVESVR